jgi:hypothetical protein
MILVKAQRNVNDIKELNDTEHCGRPMHAPFSIETTHAT